VAGDSEGPAIVIVGSMNIDLIAYAARLPERGETVMGERFAMGFGGKGANQAVMAARLGGRVLMVGGLGDDSYGELTLANLASAGIDASGVQRFAGSSGVAPIWVEPDGSNRIIVVPGANLLLDPARAAADVRGAARVDVVVGQFEIAQHVTAAGFAAARARGATTILNPAPAAPIDPELLAVTDWLIPNETELAAIAGMTVPDDLEADGQRALAALAGRLGVRLLVTLGERGAALVTGDGSVVRVAAPRVDAVDTTGAGDAFVGAFAWALASGMDEASAARVGCAIAADSVLRPGTQSSFPAPERAAAIVAEVLRAG